jgi:hypothetical protein
MNRRMLSECRKDDILVHRKADRPAEALAIAIMVT